MAKTQRAIQHWNQWFKEPFGKYILNAEHEFLTPLSVECHGQKALLIGLPSQEALLKFSVIPYQFVLSPLLNQNKITGYIEADFYELPISSASLDLVLLPHTLEYMDNPHRLLTEACRVVKPEGYIIIFGFNPYSLFGLRQKFAKRNERPWSGNFMTASLIKKWLNLADFELVKFNTFLYSPPNYHPQWVNKMKLLEWLGSKLWSPLGGIYMVMAQAKVIPLTPIKLRWKQQLSGIHATMPGPSARNY